MGTVHNWECVCLEAQQKTSELVSERSPPPVTAHGEETRPEMGGKGHWRDTLVEPFC